MSKQKEIKLLVKLGFFPENSQWHLLPLNNKTKEYVSRGTRINHLSFFRVFSEFKPDDILKITIKKKVKK